MSLALDKVRPISRTVPYFFLVSQTYVRHAHVITPYVYCVGYVELNSWRKQSRLTLCASNVNKVQNSQLVGLRGSIQAYYIQLLQPAFISLSHKCNLSSSRLIKAPNEFIHSWWLCRSIICSVQLQLGLKFNLCLWCAYVILSDNLRSTYKFVQRGFGSGWSLIVGACNECPHFLQACGVGS